MAFDKTGATPVSLGTKLSKQRLERENGRKFLTVESPGLMMLEASWYDFGLLPDMLSDYRPFPRCFDPIRVFASFI